MLYRLPELIEGVADKKIIFVVEGERDANSLHQLGVTATTCPMGAGKWNVSYSEVLRGTDVILLPDNDAAGRQHVQTVAASLHGIAKRIRVIDLVLLNHKPESFCRI